MVGDQIRSSFQGWDLFFYGNLHARELQSFLNLSAMLDQVHLNNDLEDPRIWKPDRSRGFSCKSTNEALQHDGDVQDFYFHKFICKDNIPARIRFFALSLGLEKINTCDVLQRKRPFMCLNPNWSVMCKKDQESIFHLFLQCDFSRHLWSKVFSEFGVIMEFQNDLKDLFQGSLHACQTKKIKVLWVSVV